MLRTQLFDQLPSTIKQGGAQPEFFLSEVESMWLTFEDDGFHRDDVPSLLPAMAMIAIWSGEVGNGGVAQFLSNRIVELMVNKKELISQALFPLDCLELLQSKVHKQLYVETLEYFAQNGELMLGANPAIRFSGCDLEKELSRRIWQAKNSLEQDIFKLFSGLKNVTYMDHTEIHQFKRGFSKEVKKRQNFRSKKLILSAALLYLRSGMGKRTTEQIELDHLRDFKGIVAKLKTSLA